MCYQTQIPFIFVILDIVQHFRPGQTKSLENQKSDQDNIILLLVNISDLYIRYRRATDDDDDRRRQTMTDDDRR